MKEKALQRTVMSSFRSGRRLFRSFQYLWRANSLQVSGGSRSISSTVRFSREGKWAWPVLAGVVFGSGYLVWRSRDQSTSILPRVTAEEGKEDNGTKKVVSRLV